MAGIARNAGARGGSGAGAAQGENGAGGALSGVLGVARRPCGESVAVSRNVAATGDGESAAAGAGGEELRVLLIGPHPLTVGGTQSVMRTIKECRIGADRISIRPTWNGYRQARNAQLVRKAAGAILRTDRATIIHAHLSNGGAYLRDGPLIALARRRGLRVVVTIHGYDFPEFAAAHPSFVRAVLRHAHGVLCLSEEALRTIGELGLGATARKLPNPLPIDHDSPPADTTEPVVLFAGAIGMRKGADVLVEAWRSLLARGTEGRCRVVGPIEDYRPPALARMSIEGAVDPRGIRPLIRAARVVTLPSRAEGMPMILTEALASGRPFVSTPVGGTAALAPCEGMIVPVEDPAALADALERFLADPSAARSVGERCRDFCRETRGPEVIGAELRTLYRSL
jgi:glycosyltransferase involved in cell wall biosynthesis